MYWALGFMRFFSAEFRAANKVQYNVVVDVVFFFLISFFRKKFAHVLEIKFFLIVAIVKTYILIITTIILYYDYVFITLN